MLTLALSSKSQNIRLDLSRATTNGERYKWPICTIIVTGCVPANAKANGRFCQNSAAGKFASPIVKKKDPAKTCSHTWLR